MTIRKLSAAMMSLAMLLVASAAPLAMAAPTLTVEQALELSQKTGRPLLAVAGNKT